MFYSKSENESYALNTLRELSDDLVIPFGFVKNASTQYNIELAKSITGAVIYLTDKKNGTVTNLSETPVYNFTAADGDNANRFELSFATITSVKPVSSSGIQVYAANKMLYINQANAQKGEIKVYTTTGQILRKLKLVASSSQTVNLHGFAPGVYSVTVQTDKGLYTQKVIVY